MEDGCAGRWIAAQAAAAGHPGDARHVTAAAQGGARWAQAILAISAARVARACHNLQLTIDPALIVIGGGIGLSPGYLDRVIAALDPLPAPQRPALARAALGADAGAIGIAALATQSQTTNREHST
jgi:predicted NBD/HSP70 family sugar kinase